MGRGVWPARVVAAAAAACVFALVLVWGLRSTVRDEDPRVRPLVVAPVPAAASQSAIVPAAAPVGLPHRVVADAPHRLLRVGSTLRGGRDIAVMRIHGGPPTPYAAGDMVSPGVRLVRILATHVELERESGLERVFLSADDDADGARSPLGPLRTQRHGADAAMGTARAREPAPVTGRADEAPRSSTAVERAIERARWP